MVFVRLASLLFSFSSLHFSFISVSVRALRVGLSPCTANTCSFRMVFMPFLHFVFIAIIILSFFFSSSGNEKNREVQESGTFFCFSYFSLENFSANSCAKLPDTFVTTFTGRRGGNRLKYDVGSRGSGRINSF